MTIRRSTIRRLQQALRGSLESFELLDGTRFYYDSQEVHKELFLFAFDLQFGRVKAEVPELYQKLTQAKDPAKVLERLEPEGTHAFLNPTALFDRDILINERRLVPNVGEEPEDLSEGA